MTERDNLEEQLIALFRSGAPDFKAAEELISRGADVNAKGRWPGENVLTQILEGYWWSEFGDNIDDMEGAPTPPHELGPDMCLIIRFFLEHGFDVHREDGTYGAECLSTLALSTFDRYIIDATKILLDAGAENIPCDGETPKDAIGSEGSFQGTCEADHHKANIFEAVYQIYEAVEQGHSYDGINSYEAAIGKKIILVLAEQPETGSVFYPVSLPNFKKENCFTKNLYFIYDGGFFRTTQYADFWVDTKLPDKPLVDVSSHFLGMIGSRIKKFTFNHRTIRDGMTSYGQPITSINISGPTKYARSHGLFQNGCCCIGSSCKNVLTSCSLAITDTVMDTNVSVTVSFFILAFTKKQGDFPNFATHLLKVLSSCCGFEVCPGCLIPTYCAFNSLNNRYSLYDRQSKCVEFGICCYVILL